MPDTPGEVSKTNRTEAMRELVRQAVDELFPRKPKPPEPTVPTIRFDVPPITPVDVVNNVFHNKGGWKTLQQAANETAEVERLRKLDEEFGMTPIPPAEF